MQPDSASSWAPYRVCNIGNSEPVELMDFIGAFEQALGVVAKKNLLPMQDGDVPATYADVGALNALTGFSPSTSVQDGIACFVRWYKNHYGV
jgi:UDP-glucuronate 4-epimerase